MKMLQTVSGKCFLSNLTFSLPLLLPLFLFPSFLCSILGCAGLLFCRVTSILHSFRDRIVLDQSYLLFTQETDAGRPNRKFSSQAGLDNRILPVSGADTTRLRWRTKCY